MRVRIDYDRCTGHGRCYTLAPGVFGCDDSGFGQVLGDEVGADLVRDAQLAEANCPEQAVILSE
ncbi:MAG: ferredoxin [Acidimicrobiales bacterium]|jgi:ferredoxin